jgi:predicted transcriptional regulator
MKTATIPSLRVDPALRQAAEELLEEGEGLSSFVEQSLREGIERRRLKGEFIARGLHARDQARQTGRYVEAAEVMRKLETSVVRGQVDKRQLSYTIRSPKRP